MSGPGRRFDPSELAGVDGAPLSDAEAASFLATSRDLESFAATATVVPTPDFADRVMVAVAAEVPPLLLVPRGARFAGLLIAVRNAWRITWSGDRPLAVRAQAFALVLLVAVAVGSTGALAAAGMSRLLADRPSPPPTVAPSVAPSMNAPTPSLPTPAPSGLPSPSTSPSPSAGASDDPRGTAEPSATPVATGDDGSGATTRPTTTPRPTTKPSTTPGHTSTPRPTDTDEPTHTPHPSDTPHPSKTPHPSDTPHPSETPGSGGGSGSGSGDDSGGGSGG